MEFPGQVGQQIGTLLLVGVAAQGAAKSESLEVPWKCLGGPVEDLQQK